MVLGRLRSWKLRSQSSLSADPNAALAVAHAADQPIDLSSLKAKSALQGGNLVAVDAEVQVPLQADVLFKLLADPKQHENIFDAIEGASCKLIAEDGPWRKFEVDLKARWKFWKVTGVCENKLHLETHADHGTVSFKLREPGFLRMYEGTWVIKPSGWTALNLHARQCKKLTSPKADVVSSPRRSSGPLSLPFPDSLTPPGSPRPAWAGLFQSMSDAMTSAMASVRQGVQTPQAPPADARWGTLASLHNPLVTVRECAASHPLSASSSRRSLSSSSCASASSTDTLDDPDSTLDQPPPLPTSSVIQIVNLRMSPKVAPPYPLGGLLKGHAQGQVEDMVKGLVASAQKLQMELLLTGALNSPSTATANKPKEVLYTRSSSGSSTTSCAPSRVSLSSHDSTGSVVSGTSSPFSAVAMRGNVASSGKGKEVSSFRIVVDEDLDE